MEKPGDSTPAMAETSTAAPHIFATGESGPVTQPPAYIPSTDSKTSEEAPEAIPQEQQQQPADTSVRREPPPATMNEASDYGFYAPPDLQPGNVNANTQANAGQQGQPRYTNLPAIPLRALGEFPACIDCPRCKYHGLTRTEKHAGTQAGIAACFLCLCLGLICAWIPFVIDSCKDTEHYCINCGAQVAVYQKSGGIQVSNIPPARAPQRPAAEQRAAPASSAAASHGAAVVVAPVSEKEQHTHHGHGHQPLVGAPHDPLANSSHGAAENAAAGTAPITHTAPLIDKEKKKWWQRK